MCREAAYDTDPLRGRRARHLLLEHPHRVGKRSHAIPAQLHIVIEPTSNDVHVAVDQPWHRTTSLKVNYLAAAPSEGHNVSLGTDGHEAALFDRNSVCLWVTSVECRKSTIAEN